MRGLAFASIALLGGALGCSAVDDFSRFKFADDGGALDLGAPDLGAPDLGAPADMTTLPGFGDGCMSACAGGLTCVKEFTGKSPAPGGICTRVCTESAGCPDLPNATCVSLNNLPYCMPRCDPFTGPQCRTGYACCSNGGVTVTVPGVCSPPTTDWCGH